MLVTITAIVAPLAKILVLLSVMLGLNAAKPPRSLPFVFKWYRRIGPWAMVEVFLLGVFVAFTRLGAIATVEIGVALYAVAALMLTMVAADYLLDAEACGRRWRSAAWSRRPPGDGTVDRVRRLRPGEPRQAGGRCSRCCNTVCITLAEQHRQHLGAACRPPCSTSRPIFPVLTITRLGRGTPSTILGGAQELLDAGMWPLALLVFVASIMVPCSSW